MSFVGTMASYAAFLCPWKSDAASAGYRGRLRQSAQFGVISIVLLFCQDIGAAEWGWTIGGFLRSTELSPANIVVSDVTDNHLRYLEKNRIRWNRGTGAAIYPIQKLDKFPIYQQFIFAGFLGAVAKYMSGFGPSAMKYSGIISAQNLAAPNQVQD